MAMCASFPSTRRGFTLFSPAPVNALAIAAFNRIRAEEPKGPPADWLATGLCYAALTEPRLAIALSPHEAPDADFGLSFPPSLEVGPLGESTVRFVNVASREPADAMGFDIRCQGPTGQGRALSHAGLRHQNHP